MSKEELNIKLKEEFRELRLTQLSLLLGWCSYAVDKVRSVNGDTEPLGRITFDTDEETVFRLIDKALSGKDKLVKPLYELEREAIRDALRWYDTRNEAAIALGISQRTLFRKIKEYGL
jgi:transcriptional regulator with PAS, ATPase and Fis domain